MLEFLIYYMIGAFSTYMLGWTSCYPLVYLKVQSFAKETKNIKLAERYRVLSFTLATLIANIFLWYIIVWFLIFYNEEHAKKMYLYATGQENDNHK